MVGYSVMKGVVSPLDVVINDVGPSLFKRLSLTFLSLLLKLQLEIVTTINSSDGRPP